MSLLLLEAAGALVLLLLIVWWTMFSGRQKGELPPHQSDPKVATDKSEPQSPDAREKD